MSFSIPKRVIGFIFFTALLFNVSPGFAELFKCTEEDGSVTVAFMDPSAVLDLVQQEGVHELAGEVKAKLERVKEGLNA